MFALTPQFTHNLQSNNCVRVYSVCIRHALHTGHLRSK